MNEKEFRDRVMSNLLEAFEFRIEDSPDKKNKHISIGITYEASPVHTKYTHIGAVVDSQAFIVHNEDYVLNKVAQGLTAQVLMRMTSGARTGFGRTLVSLIGRYL